MDDTMKLWVISAPQKNDRWGYDCTYALVVRADSEDAARVMAARGHGDEGSAVWADAEVTSCEELLAEGEPEVIVRDFLAD